MNGMADWSKEIITLGTPYALRVIGVLVLIVVAWIVAGWTKRAINRTLTRAEFDLTLTRFFGNMSRWVVLLLAILAALGVFGVETTSFAAVIAAGGLAIGLAFQGTLSNFAAGIMLLIFRPFSVGNVVNVAGHTGSIFEIGLFTTAMDTPDNRRIILPNSAIFGSTIENISYHDTRRVDVSIGTDYSADIDRTRTRLKETAEAIEKRLDDKEVAIVLTGLGASSIDWSVRVWVNAADYWAVKDALTRDLKVALDGAGIGIPFPQMDLHLDQPVS